MCELRLSSGNSLHCKTTALLTTTPQQLFSTTAITLRSSFTVSGPVLYFTTTVTGDYHLPTTTGDFDAWVSTPTVGPVPPTIKEPGPGRFATISESLIRGEVFRYEAQIWRIHHSHMIVTLAQGNNKTGIHYRPWTTIKSFMVAELSSELGS